MITNKDLSIDSENGKITLNGNKYDLGTQGEIDTAVNDVYSVMGQMGAKNLIPYPYTNAYRTTNGVTITEGSITGSCVFNGTSTGRVDANLGYHNSNALTLLPSVQYCLSIKTDGSFVGNLAVEAWNKGTTTYAKSIARVTPSSTGSDYKEVKFSVTQSDINNYDIAVVIYGNSGNTFNNVTVYPMLRLAEDTDDTYQPYAKTNKQLTDQVAEVKGTIGDLTQTGVTGSDVATQIETLNTALTYGAGDVITAENVVTAAVGANTSDCYFSVPISKPVTATTVTISDVSCNLYYGTNQMEAVTEGTYTATIEGGSLLVKLTKANTFSQYGRYIVDFTGTFTFS